MTKFLKKLSDKYHNAWNIMNVQKCQLLLLVHMSYAPLNIAIHELWLLFVLDEPD